MPRSNADPASLLYNLSIAYGPNDPYSDWGVSLSTLFGLTDGSGPMDFGNMTVMWAGIEMEKAVQTARDSRHQLDHCQLLHSRRRIHIATLGL